MRVTVALLLSLYGPILAVFFRHRLAVVVPWAMRLGDHFVRSTSALSTPMFRAKPEFMAAIAMGMLITLPAFLVALAIEGVADKSRAPVTLLDGAGFGFGFTSLACWILFLRKGASGETDQRNRNS